MLGTESFKISRRVKRSLTQPCRKACRYENVIVEYSILTLFYVRSRFRIQDMDYFGAKPVLVTCLQQKAPVKPKVISTIVFSKQLILFIYIKSNFLKDLQLSILEGRRAFVPDEILLLFDLNILKHLVLALQELDLFIILDTIADEWYTETRSFIKDLSVEQFITVRHKQQCLMVYLILLGVEQIAFQKLRYFILLKHRVVNYHLFNLHFLSQFQQVLELQSSVDFLHEKAQSQANQVIYFQILKED